MVVPPVSHRECSDISSAAVVPAEVPPWVKSTVPSVVVIHHSVHRHLVRMRRVITSAGVSASASVA